jgi:hypothetical protein
VLSSGGLIDDSGTPVSRALPFMFFVLAGGGVVVLPVAVVVVVVAVLQNAGSQ